MSFKLKHNFFLYKNISLNITLSLISQMYRILEEDTSSNSDNQTSAEENKRKTGAVSVRPSAAPA